MHSRLGELQAERHELQSAAAAVQDRVSVVQGRLAFALSPHEGPGTAPTTALLIRPYMAGSPVAGVGEDVAPRYQPPPPPTTPAVRGRDAVVEAAAADLRRLCKARFFKGPQEKVWIPRRTGYVCPLPPWLLNGAHSSSGSR